LATVVLRHPWRVLLPVLVVLAALGAPFAGAQLSTPDARILPPDTASRRAVSLLASEFDPGAGAPLLLAVTAPGPITAPPQLDVLFAFTRTVARDPRVARVESIVDLDPRLTREQYALLYANPGQSPDLWARGAAQALARGNTTLVSVVPKLDPIGPETKALVKALRATVPAPGWRVEVGGAAAGALDLTESLYRDFPAVVAAVLAATYLLLLVTFRSVVLPAKAVVMNLLSLVASYGALVVVFQDGLLAGLPPPAARLRRGHAADPALLHALRSIDGLRGIPAQSGAGGLRGDGRQRQQHSGGPAAQRARHHRGSGDRRRRRGRVRARRRRGADQGARVGDRDRRAGRRDHRARTLGAGDDAPPRHLELVAPTAAGPPDDAAGQPGPRRSQLS
jgi:hypothetical protein